MRDETLEECAVICERYAANMRDPGEVSGVPAPSPDLRAFMRGQASAASLLAGQIRAMMSGQGADREVRNE